MGDNAKVAEKTPKKSWFKGLKSEFRKIIWPDKESLAKQSVAVIIVTTVVAILIALVDFAIKAGIDTIL